MNNPQLENGYVKIANEIFDALCKIRINGEARQVFDFILRKTYGFNKKEDRIALSQFEIGTGLKKNAICKAIKKLKDMKLIIVTQKENEIAKGYCISKGYTTWKALPKKRMYPKKRIVVSQKENLGYPKKSTTKDTLTKDNTTKDILDAFELFWSVYPRKEGKTKALKHFKASVKSQDDIDRFSMALKKYLYKLKIENTEPKYIKHGSSFFNNWEDYVDFEPPEQQSSTKEWLKKEGEIYG